MKILAHLKPLLFICACISVLSSCQQVPPTTQQIIQKSGNEAELAKVIAHYKETGETQKLKAFYYLLEHIGQKMHATGKSVSEYDLVFQELCTTPPLRREWLAQIFDSLQVKHQVKFPGSFEMEGDLAILKSRDLIQHIDAAFVAWNYPWARHLSFDDFCLYLLPYKLVQEQPEVWAKQIQEQYRPLIQKLGNTNDPYEVCLAVNDRLKKDFKIRTLPAYWDVNFSKLNQIRSGKCYHATQYTTYVMRALGIPVAMDFTPLWGNMNGGHEWNALLWKGKSIPFIGSESDPGKTKVDLALQRKRSKVFRHTYEIQKNGLQHLTQGTEEIPYLFKTVYLKDVTKDYVPVSTVAIDLNKAHQQFNYAFLCVFNRQEWKPIWWSANQHGKAMFQDMGREVAYLPAYYAEGRVVPAANPLLLHADGTTEVLDGNGVKQPVVIKKKGPQGPSIIKGQTYELFFWKNGWQLHGKQEAQADSILFNKVPAHTLLWVKSKDKSTNERIFLYQDKQLWW